MLDPDVVLDAVVTAIQSVPSVAAYVGQRSDGSSAIYGHNFLYGTENAIAKALYEMSSPSILVAYTKYLGGRFNQMTLWKHMLEVYVRPMNTAAPGAGGGPPPCSTQHLLYLILNSPLGTVFPLDAQTGAPAAGTQRIYEARLLSNLLPMDLPSFAPRQDDTLTDFFCAGLVIPEYGDLNLAGAG